MNLAEQTLAVYQDHRLVFATMIASGVEPFWTRPGSYQIYSKVESETMRNNDPSDFYYLENVPWTMYFDGPRALARGLLADAVWLPSVARVREPLCRRCALALQLGAGGRLGIRA